MPSFRALARFQLFVSFFVALLLVSVCSVSYAADPLPSWNEGPAKKSILEFVAAVTDKNSKDYVAPADEGLGTFIVRKLLIRIRNVVTADQQLANYECPLDPSTPRPPLRPRSLPGEIECGNGDGFILSKRWRGK